MKKLLFVVAAVATLSAFASVSKSDNAAAKNHKSEEAPATTNLVKVGGVGFVAIVDAGGAPSDGTLNKVQGMFEELLQAYVKVMKGSWSLATASKDVAATKANAAVFVVNDKTLPISLISLEARWAVVNSNGLSASAVSKEITRVTTVLLGSCYSQYEGSVMRPAFSAEDIDKKIGEALTLDVILPLLNGFSSLGLQPFALEERPVNAQSAK